jgi:hypothetical protein
VGEEPGLKSVASATVAPASSSRAPARSVFRPRKKSVAGSSVATVAEPASAAMPASLTAPRWSADAAPSSTASSAPPGVLQLVGVQLRDQAVLQPGLEDASRLRAVNTPGSMNTSQKRPAAPRRRPGSSPRREVDVASRSSRYSGGNLVRAEERRHQSSGTSAQRRIARSCFSSLSVSRP